MQDVGSTRRHEARARNRLWLSSSLEKLQKIFTRQAV